MKRQKTMLKYGKTWILIFHHLNSSGVFDSETCLHSEEEGKYSELGSISSLFLINDNYEFILEYPGVGEIAWKQHVSPLDVTEKNVETDDIGLVITHNDYNFVYFKGLMKSSENYSCFDCDKRKLADFWYSIGLINKYGGIPGPLILKGANCTENEVSEVKLWIRIPSEKQSCMQIKKNAHSYLAFII